MLHLTLPLMLAGALPYLFTLLAKAGAFSGRDNHRTRDWQAKLTGWRQRAHWAHQNSFEIFPLFAAAMIVAHLAAPGNGRASLAAWAFVGSRVVYGVCYIADAAALRSLVWFGGVACIVVLFSLGLR